MKTIIPAQPGYYLVYPDRRAVPVIAWEITHVDDLHGYTTWPITPNGSASDDYEIRYIDARGRAITVRG